MMLYHGTVTPNIQKLEPCSLLHGSHRKVVYLTGELAYGALYVWDSEKTGSTRKHITAWVKGGITHYEEQFPNQLQAFYQGVKGWVYCVDSPAELETMKDREGIFYSSESIVVEKILPVDSVLELLLREQQRGTFCLHRYQDASQERQQELTHMIASWIVRQNLLNLEGEDSDFYRRYFPQAWETAFRMA